MSSMKGVALVCLLAVVGLTSAAQSDEDYHCQAANGVTKGSSEGFPREVCYIEQCARKIQLHIKEELHAAFYYMYLAARFDQDLINRPGLAKFLYESASEEREHAILMLDYLNTRGIPFEESYSFGSTEMTKLNELVKVLNYKSALETALNLEIDVTKKVYDIIEACGNDFHGADVFTDPILNEQHEGVRKLQGALQTFTDLTKGHTDNPDELALAEYIFDSKLLSGAF